MYQSGRIPESWAVGTLPPIPEPKKTLTAATCRPAKVLPVPAGILSDVVASRSVKWAGVNEDQASFIPGRIPLEHVLTLYVLAESAVIRKKHLFDAFLDYSNAFNSVKHTRLWENLARQGVPAVAMNYLFLRYQKAKLR